MAQSESYWDLFKSKGVSRRDFIKYCSLTSVYLGLSATMVPKIVQAMETKKRIPVIWLHGLECTCCSESFLRSSHPLTADIILNMLSLEVDDTIQAAAGHQVEEHRENIMKENWGEYILAVEGNVPLKENGAFCTVAGKSFKQILEETAAGAKAVISWGTCASFGCVQAAKPNPTGATPIHKLVKDKPVINIPGCPPIAEVMTGTLTHILTFGSMPELDRLKRPKVFYGRRIHDKCYRRPYFDAGLFVESFDSDEAKQGWCLYKMGCKGPTTSNSCSVMRWNAGVSYPIQSGHPCLGCSEPNFWDTNSPFYTRQANISFLGTNSTADTIGKVAAGVAGGAMAAHAVGTSIQQRKKRKEREQANESQEAKEE